MLTLTGTLSMPFHPTQANWFEAEVPRDQTVYALASLAENGSVELEDEGDHSAPCVDKTLLRKHLSAFEVLKRRYASDLPSVPAPGRKHIEQPERLAEDAVGRLREWVSRFLRTRRRVLQVKEAIRNLGLLENLLDAMGPESEGLNAFVPSTKMLFKGIYVCPTGEIDPAEINADVFEQHYRGDEHDFLIVAGLPERKPALEEAVALLGCDRLRLPDWLPSGAPAQRQMISNRKLRLDAELAGLNKQLANLRSDSGVSSSIADLNLLRWYLTVFVENASNRRACRLAGWTTAANAKVLEDYLLENGIHAEVVFTPPRAGLKPPVVMETTGWSEPFHWFVRLLGTPGRNEVDPAPLLSVLVPLLFGFMFPDLGHGLVLAVAGWLAAKRYPDAAILIPCGLAAAGFGLVFGEFFGIRGLFPSPCGCPLDNPIRILVATLVLGVSVMLLGLVFSGVEAAWRNEVRGWLLAEAPVVALYLFAVSMLVWTDAWVVCFFALIWYFTGAIILCWRQAASCFWGRIGQLIESGFQLTVGTLSFLRVGAFALAHGAFSIVISELVSLVELPVLQAMVFILGHLFVIVVEGAIVMIQTTRLVLFEFFSRFLKFDGRIYKPLKKPDQT